MPAAWPRVGQLVSNGRLLRDRLDTDFHGLRVAVRALAAAEPEWEFVAAVRQLEDVLINAERHAAAIDTLAAAVQGALDKLGASVISESFVVPPKPAEGGRAEASVTS